MILITPNVDPNGANEFVSDHPVGAYYNPSLKQWGVLNEDGTPMGVGAHFNIMIGAKASNGGSEFLTKAKSGNSSGSFVFINSPDAIGNPNAAVFETPILILVALAVRSTRLQRVLNIFSPQTTLGQCSRKTARA